MTPFVAVSGKPNVCRSLLRFRGVGDIKSFVSIRRALGHRFPYLNGLRAAELFAGELFVLSASSYSA